MGLIPDISKIVSGFFDDGGGATNTHTTMGSSADSQGSFFRKRIIEGLDGAADIPGDTDGDGIVSIQELQALHGASATKFGPISPKLWPVLKYYGKVVNYEGTERPKGLYYVNEFGIIRKTAGGGTGCADAMDYTTGSSITDDEFDNLLLNGGQNFNTNGEAINAMSATTQCGIDGKFIESEDGGENGWIEPTTGLYRKFEGGIAAADESCGALKGTTSAVSGVSPSDYVGTGKGETYSSSTPCTFPTHVGERNITQWTRVVEDEIRSSAQYTGLMAGYKAARDEYMEFMDKNGDQIKVPKIIPHLSQYYGKHVAVYDENSDGNDASERYYISPFGFPRKWVGVNGGKWNGIGSAWLTRPESCKGGTMDVVNHISAAHLAELKSKAGSTEMGGESGNMTPMNMNEPCNVSGKFITSASGSNAWVDVLGFKHTFNGTEGDTCTDMETMQVTNTEFSAITDGTGYEEGTQCGVSGMDADIFTLFIAHQSDLIAKGAEALDATKELQTSGGEVRTQVATQQTALEEEVGSLASQQGQVANNQANLINAKGRFDTGGEQTTYTFRMYVVWLIVALLVMAVAIHAMVSGENTIFVYGVLGLCAFIMVYYTVVRGMRG